MQFAIASIFTSCWFVYLKGGFWGTILSAIFTFILTIGQMTTKGSVKNTKLTPAPVDNCPITEVANWLMNKTFVNQTSTIFLINTTASVVESASIIPEAPTEP